MGPKLLIVEDETALRGVLLRSLRAEGFDAAAVATGRELIERALRSPAPDALMIDIGLPDADGRDLCQALRARGMQTPVLFLTARDALVERTNLNLRARLRLETNELESLLRQVRSKLEVSLSSLLRE